MDQRLPRIVSPTRNTQLNTILSPNDSASTKKFLLRGQTRESPITRRRAAIAAYPHALPAKSDSDDPISPTNNSQLSKMITAKFSDSRQEAEANKKNRLANGDILAHKPTAD